MRIVLAPGTCYTELPDGSAAVVTPTTGQVLHLDTVAVTCVAAMSEYDRDTAVTVLAAHFDAAPAIITADLDNLTATLSEHGVITGGAA